METAKAALPQILKVLLCVATVLMILPMAVFISLPHVFFGYFHSANPPVVLATDQAMELGNVCMSLDEFQNTVIDSIITAIVNSYEQAGIHIDEIRIENHFEEDDLLWFISINSVANKQNLDEISVDRIKELCADKLDYRWSLLAGEKTILKIVIEKIDPDVWMEKLAFPEDARTWTRAFDETLTESDALDKYGAYYTGHTPNYGGDPTAPDYPDTPQRPPDNPEPGGGYSNGLDTTGYVNPTVKNNLDLTTYATRAWENGWGYVWGTFGNVLTPSLFEYKLRQYPDGVGNHAAFIREHWVGRRTADCIGLIKGYGWLNPNTLQFDYGSHGMPDYGANQMCTTAKNRGVQGRDWGSISTIPEIPGLGLWAPGHAGIYIGGGYAIEAMGTRYGVVKTQVAKRNWQTWYKIPSITYYAS